MAAKTKLGKPNNPFNPIAAKTRLRVNGTLCVTEERMKYDDASWHSGGNFPAGSPPEYGGTHIALFLRWCFSKGWVGELHRSEEPDDTQRLVEGKMSAVEYFFKYCDGKLTN